MTLTEWLSHNLLGLVTLLAYTFAQCLLVARSMWQASQTAARVKHIESLLQDHMSSHSLHRTPDFEERLRQLEKLLDEIHRDVKQLLDRNHTQRAK